MNKEFKSMLEKIAVEVNQAKQEQFAEIKSKVFAYISVSRVKEESKKRMLDNVFSIIELRELQKYICNSLLFFEGMSPNRYKK